MNLYNLIKMSYYTETQCRKDADEYQNLPDYVDPDKFYKHLFEKIVEYLDLT